MSNIDDFVIKNGVLKEYNGRDIHIKIPVGVTKIGKEALWRGPFSKEIVSVTIPEGVREIDDDAFGNLKNLTEVTIPSTVKKIGEYAFNYCPKLKSITIPDSVTSIGRGVFNRCGSLEFAHLPEGLTEISDSLFCGCENLSEVNIPETVKQIGKEAFYDCSKLSEIHLPETVEKIGEDAFSYCGGLQKLYIPEGCKIETGALKGCTGLVDKNSMLIIDNRLHVCFAGDKEEFTAIIPDTVEVIEPRALRGDFFRGVRWHLEMNIHCPAWENQGWPLFAGSRDGSTISFCDDTGAIVAKVIMASFDEKTSLEWSIAQKNHTFDFIGYDAYWAKLDKAYNKIRVALVRLQYPYALSSEMREEYETFISKRSLNAAKILIDEDNIHMLSVMSEMQFFNKETLQKLVDYANENGNFGMTAQLLNFQNTAAKEPVKKKEKKPKPKESSLWKRKPGSQWIGRYLGTETEITFPKEENGLSIEGIADTAGVTPENYKELRSVVIPEGYTYIGSRAFAGCEKLENVKFPSTLRYIGGGAFGEGVKDKPKRGRRRTEHVCGNLQQLYIPKGVSLGGNVFYKAKIRVLVIESDGSEIPKDTFNNCHIDDLVILGGNYRSKGFLFDDKHKYTTAPRIFPERIWINGSFDCLDIRDYPYLIKQIHSLSEFDESIIHDDVVRALITEEKKRAIESDNQPVQLAVADNVERVEFAGSNFVHSGFDDKHKLLIEKLLKFHGAEIKGSVSSKVQYLIIPDGDVVKTTKYKKAVELQEKGINIAILTFSELKRHIHILNESLYGSDGADVLDNYLVTFKTDGVCLDLYIGNETEVTVPKNIGSYPVTELKKECFVCSDNRYLLTALTDVCKVVIQENITEIPEGLFRSCTKLEFVVLPEGLISIGEDAFLACCNLNEIHLPKTLREIGESAFHDCEKLKEIILPDGLTTLKYGAFSYCKGLTRMVIPSSVTHIESLFSRCENLSEIIVDPDNAVYDSRENCNAIIEKATDTLVSGCKFTVCPDSVLCIGQRALCNLGRLTEFSVPEGVVEIKDGAFEFCNRLYSVHLPATLERIGKMAFYNTPVVLTVKAGSYAEQFAKEKGFGYSVE